MGNIRNDVELSKYSNLFTKLRQCIRLRMEYSQIYLSDFDNDYVACESYEINM